MLRRPRVLARFALGLGLTLGAFACTSPDRPFGADTTTGGATGHGGAGGHAGTGGRGGSSTGGEAIGAPCGDKSECASGFCVDGVCCNAACTSDCHACSAQLTGKGDGDCSAVLAGTDPHGSCPDDGAASCGRSGACGPQGTCALYAAGTECSPQTCTGSTKTLAKTCDGAGTCAESGTVPCAAGCMGLVCAGDCSGDASCQAGEYCELGSGKCLAKNPSGSACQAGKANQCQSGFCADGVCCEGACAGPCEACSKALTGQPDGTCAAAPAGSDPDGDCADQGAATCGTDGACDGARACRKYASGTVCAPGSCGSGVVKSPSTCDGSGACKDGSSSSCASCSGTVCSSGCTSSAQCLNGLYCSAGACVPTKALGLSCAAAEECQSMTCADGVCCNTACGGSCQACSVAKKGSGSNGTCGPVVAGLDPDDECADQGAASCGTNGGCDGAGACQKYPAGTACGSTSCSGHTQTSGGSCDGSGSCGAGGTTDCAPYVCGATACKTSCAGDADCTTGSYCAAGGCVAKKPVGSGCGASSECSTPACVDGVCCNADCAGLCTACSGAKKGSGADGVCGAIAAGLDPDNECTDQGAPTCGTDGACNGAGACEKYAVGTVCGAASCAGGSQTAAGTCNASGQCAAGSTTSCGAYACGATACKTSCTSDADCSSGNVCAAGTCGPKLPQGSACTTANQCQTGFCVDGWCCNTACTGTCRSCDGTWTLGGLNGTCDVIDCADPNNECPGTYVCLTGACKPISQCP